MFGKNPIRPPEKGDGSLLQIQKIFPTLQGEGPFAGHPAIFIRLGGCNLACDFCDTEFESFEQWRLGDVVDEANKMRRKIPPPLEGGSGLGHGGHSANQAPHLASPLLGEELIVITGGEPFRQNIAPLCDALLKSGFEVQVETNGTLYRPLDPRVHIVCSPKTTTGAYARLREDLLAHTSALKFIVSASHPLYRNIPEVGQSDYKIPIYVQPMDEYDPEKNARNLTYAKDLAMNQGYRLSLQLHKLLGIE